MGREVKNKDASRNLTTGSVFGRIVGFSLPFLLSYFMQSFYGLADLFITGLYNETSSITAVSIGSQVMHMLTVMIVGLAMGTTVTLGHAVGAKDKRLASETIGNTVTLFAGLSVVITLILLIAVKPLVALISTPAEAVSGTVSYLAICFIGIPFITAYNIISSIFRGLGDSKTPMYFIAVACVLNVALDFLFIGKLGMGPAGAALGTTLAQTASVAVALLVLLRRKMGLISGKESFKVNRDIISKILRIGLPVSLQDGFIQISFIIITIIANRRGLDDAAAVGIVEKVISLIFLVPSTMLSTVSALSAQNIGAGKHDRAVKTLGYGTLICVLFGLLVSGVVQFTYEPIVALFDSNPAVILAGGQYLRGYVWDCLFAGVHFCFSGYFCACGRSELSFLHNVISIILARVPGAYFMSYLFADTLFPMGFAIAMGSLLSVIICIVAFIIIEKKYRQSIKKIIK